MRTAISWDLDEAHSILAGAIPLCPEAVLQARWACADESVSLQRLVILDMLGKLTEWISSGRAFGASKESHRAWVKREMEG